jgi:hypothetical protein
MKTIPCIPRRVGRWQTEEKIARSTLICWTAARPGERFDDELDETGEDLYDEQDERLKASGALAEGEPVGEWTDQDEEPNTFDAASEVDEYEDEDELDPDEFEALDGGSLGGVEPTDKRRHEH